jgi:hypothetical protein
MSVVSWAGEILEVFDRGSNGSRTEDTRLIWWVRDRDNWESKAPRKVLRDVRLYAGLWWGCVLSDVWERHCWMKHQPRSIAMEWNPRLTTEDGNETCESRSTGYTSGPLRARTDSHYCSEVGFCDLEFDCRAGNLRDDGRVSLSWYERMRFLCFDCCCLCLEVPKAHSLDDREGTNAWTKREKRTWTGIAPTYRDNVNVNGSLF